MNSQHQNPRIKGRRKDEKNKDMHVTHHQPRAFVPFPFYKELKEKGLVIRIASNS
jgi:hypothetical protein